MRFLTIGIAFYLVFLPLSKISAQETYTWQPYAFSIMLPEGWITAEQEDRLLLGEPENVNAALEGNPAPGLLITVEWIAPGEVNRDTFRFGERVEGETKFQLDMGVYQGQATIVAETFLIIASAPTAQWDNFAATVNDVIANIDAQPAIKYELTQPFAWRNLSLVTPADWQIASANSSDILLLSTLESRQQMAATFLPQNLLVLVRDVSYIRSLLSEEDIPSLTTIWYQPENYRFEQPVSLDIEGASAVAMNFTSGDVAGQALLIFTPRHAYLLVGLAGAAQWQTTEQALFQQILATLEFNP